MMIELRKLIVLGAMLSAIAACPLRGDETGAPRTKAPLPQGPQEKGPRIIINAAREKPPERVKLPRAGLYPAADILSLAGVLTGRTVRLESERVRDTRVAVEVDAGENEVGLQELTLILAAHKLFLFPITDPKEGEVLVVSRNPDWKEEPPRFTKVLEVGSKGFKSSWEKVKSALAAENAKIPKGEPVIVAVPDERTGKIILGAPKEAQLEDLKKSLEKEIQTTDPDRPRMYTYSGRYRKAEDIEKGLREKLSEADLNRMRIVIASKGNRLLFRGPAEVWEKVDKALKELDQKAVK